MRKLTTILFGAAMLAVATPAVSQALDALLADKEALKSVLLYHVVPGKVMAADAVKLAGKSAKMVSGAEAKISVMGNTVLVNQAHVTATDIVAKNGVIHVIDAVILPPKAGN